MMDKNKYHLKKVQPIRNRQVLRQTPKESKATTISPKNHNQHLDTQDIKKEIVKEMDESEVFSEHNTFKIHSQPLIEPAQRLYLQKKPRNTHISGIKIDKAFSKKQIKTIFLDGCKFTDAIPRVFQLTKITADKAKQSYQNLLFQLQMIKQQNHPHEQFAKKMRQNEIQIKKDIERTQPKYEMFRKKEWKDKCQRILMCYGIADPQVGYVQGLNIIVSGILYHVKNESNSYCVFWKILSIARRIYVNNFIQYYDTVKDIEKLTAQLAPKVYQHFQENEIQMSILLFPWQISLLTGIVPIEYVNLIFQEFIIGEWRFLNRLTVSILCYYQKQLIQLKDSADILQFLAPTSLIDRQADWITIISNATSNTS